MLEPTREILKERSETINFIFNFANLTINFHLINFLMSNYIKSSNPDYQNYSILNSKCESQVLHSLILISQTSVLSLCLPQRYRQRSHPATEYPYSLQGKTLFVIGKF